jgi:hypothetical protein
LVHTVQGPCHYDIVLQFDGNFFPHQSFEKGQKDLSCLWKR